MGWKKRTERVQELSSNYDITKGIANLIRVCFVLGILLNLIIIEDNSLEALTIFVFIIVGWILFEFGYQPVIGILNAQLILVHDNKRILNSLDSINESINLDNNVQSTRSRIKPNAKNTKKPPEFNDKTTESMNKQKKEDTLITAEKKLGKSPVSEINKKEVRREVPCPFCAKILSIPWEYSFQVHCPECNKSFDLPELKLSTGVRDGSI